MSKHPAREEAQKGERAMKNNGSNVVGNGSHTSITGQKIGRASAKRRAAWGALYVLGIAEASRSVANAARLFHVSPTHIASALRELLQAMSQSPRPEPVRPIHQPEPVAELHH